MTADDSDRDTDGGSFDFTIKTNAPNFVARSGNSGSFGNKNGGHASWKANQDRANGMVYSGDISSTTIENSVWNLVGINQVLFGTGSCNAQ